MKVLLGTGMLILSEDQLSPTHTRPFLLHPGCGRLRQTLEADSNRSWR